MHICTPIDVDTLLHRGTTKHIHTLTYRSRQTQMYKYTQIHRYTCIDGDTHMQVHTDRYVHICTHRPADMSTRAYVSMHVPAYTHIMHRYTYICTQAHQ